MERPSQVLAMRAPGQSPHYDKVFLHLASPAIGNDVRRLVRELAALAGVARVAPGSRASNLLRIDYDPARISMRTLLACARRGWAAVRRVGMMSGASA